MAGLIVHVPGEPLNDKTGLLANIFGIAGFIQSVGIVDAGAEIPGLGDGALYIKLQAFVAVA